MIDYISQDKYSAAKRIWMVCFGDNNDYTDFIFSRLISPSKVLAYTDSDGQISAMLCLQPFTMVSPAGNADAVYIFGVATLPQWRKQGIASQLLRETQKRMLDSGVAVAALVPAGEKMFPFYEKQGFETTFFVQKKLYTTKDLPTNPRPCELKLIALDEMLDMRNHYYGGRTFFARWSYEYVKYIGLETQALGGEILAINCENASGYVVCYPYKDSLIIKELTVSGNIVGDVVAALHTRFGKAGSRLHLPADTFDAGSQSNVPFAMLKWYDPAVKDRLSGGKGGSPYIAHVLDGPTLGVSLKIIP